MHVPHRQLWLTLYIQSDKKDPPQLILLCYYLYASSEPHDLMQYNVPCPMYASIVYTMCMTHYLLVAAKPDAQV